MGYRGGDLDLRMPQPRAGERGSFEPPLNGGHDLDDSFGAGPIFVDETLLACCNHAYDVALAHRASDVRIEHLVFALTRIDKAAEVLEKHGVRDASLRREAGVYIASEIPIAPTNGQATPRRSQALEQALKLAAKHAYTRNRPASVADLLHVFTDVKPELPGLQLLHRHMLGFAGDQQMDTASYRMAEPGYYPAVSMEPMRRPMRPAYYDDYPMAEPVQYRQAPSHTDMVQNSRLAALEKLVMGLREDTGRFTDDLAGRFVSLEASVSGGGGSDGIAFKQTVDKLAGLERGLLQKLEELSRQAAFLSNRLEKMEDRLESAYSSGGIDLSPLEQRLERLEASMREERSSNERTVQAAGERIVADVDSRVRSLETAIREKEVGAVDLMPVEGRLNDIETALLSFTESTPSLDAVTQRLAALERDFANRLGSVQQQGGEVANQVRTIAQAINDQSGAMQRVETALQERIGAISGLVQDMQGGRADLQSRFEKLETLVIRHGQEAAEGRETGVRELGEVHEAIVKLNANQHTLAGAIDQWRSEAVNDMNTISTRLVQLDHDNDAPMQRLEAISERMDGLYRATVERYHRRNRFWYWLFGTDDWIGKSWPSQTAKVEEELRMARTAAAQPPA